MDLFVPSKLKEKVEEWRKEGYSCNYPAIAEILNFNLYSFHVSENNVPKFFSM